MATSVIPQRCNNRGGENTIKILNLQSEFNLEELDKIRQRPVRPEMAETPSEELLSALGKLKNGKASGETGVLPEMLKAACFKDGFLDMLLELVRDAWGKSEVPEDWCDALLVYTYTQER